MTFLDAIIAMHVAAGGVALVSFWIPMAAAKGGWLHRKAGWVYVTAMGVAAVTAIVACLWRLTGDGTSPGRRIGSWFLLYVAVLSAASSSLGVRVLRFKARTGPHRGLWDLGLAGALVLSGLGIGALGLRLRVPLLAGFSLVGIFVGGSQLYYWMRPPVKRMHWWFEHMGGMVGASIGTLTAFLVVNAPRLGLSPRSLLAWLAPSVVGAVALGLWTRHYERRFDPARATRRGAAEHVAVA